MSASSNTHTKPRQHIPLNPCKTLQHTLQHTAQAPTQNRAKISRWPTTPTGTPSLPKLRVLTTQNGLPSKWAGKSPPQKSTLCVLESQVAMHEFLVLLKTLIKSLSKVNKSQLKSPHKSSLVGWLSRRLWRLWMTFEKFLQKSSNVSSKVSSKAFSKVNPLTFKETFGLLRRLWRLWMTFERFLQKYQKSS